MNPAANEEDEQANEDSEGVEDQDNGSEEGDEESVEEEEEEDGVESVDSRAEDDDGEMAVDVPPVAMHNGSSYARTPLTQNSNTDDLLLHSAGGSRFRV